MSDTPRTDAAEESADMLASPTALVVPADFARTLERELAAATKERDAIRRQWNEREPQLRAAETDLDQMRVAYGQLQHKLEALQLDNTAQCLLLGKSGSREAALLAEIANLKKERDRWRIAYRDVCNVLGEAVDRREELKRHADALAEALDGVELACKRIRSGADKDHAIWCIETKAVSALAAYRASQTKP